MLKIQFTSLALSYGSFRPLSISNTSNKKSVTRINRTEYELSVPIEKIFPSNVLELSHRSEYAAGNTGGSVKHIERKFGDDLDTKYKGFVLGVIKAKLPEILCIVVRESNEIGSSGQNNPRNTVVHVRHLNYGVIQSGLSPFIQINPMELAAL